MRSGVGGGWDIIAPKGWGMAFWVAMVYRGARVGGLREARSLATRSGQLHFPHDFPDSSAGHQQEQESQSQCIDVHVRRPPAKRVGYHRLGVPAPFHCPFAKLVAEWQEKAPQLLNTEEKVENVTSVDSKETVPQLVFGASAADPKVSSSGSPRPEGEQQKDAVGGVVMGVGDGVNVDAPCPELYVVRCRRLLRALQEALQGTAPRPNPRNRGQNQVGTRLSAFLNQPHCRALVSENICGLVPVASSCLLRGVPAERAMICLPSEADLEQLAKDSNFGGPVEHLHSRCRTRVEKIRKKGKKGKKAVAPTSNVTADGADKQKQPRGTEKSLNAKQGQEKAELLKEPSRIVGTTDRPIIGFLTAGDFDLGQGHGSGVGFCSLVGLLAALERVNTNKPLLVLVRNPTSRQYRFGHLSVLL